MSVIDEAIKLRNLIEQMAENLDDETAEQNPNVFPKWAVGVEYKRDYKIRYNDIVYKVLQDHTSQADWAPDETASLYVKVHQQDPEDEWPEWEQPTAENPYMSGDKVTFEGKHYISLIDNNVWSPSAYPQGWQLVENGEEE